MSCVRLTVESALFFFNDTATPEIYTLSLHDALPIFIGAYRDLDDELNRRAWRDTLPRFALRPAALDANRYRRFARFLQAQKMIEDIPPLETYAVELP